jgi:hypothetical protein
MSYSWFFIRSLSEEIYLLHAAQGKGGSRHHFENTIARS